MVNLVICIQIVCRYGYLVQLDYAISALHVTPAFAIAH